MRAIFTDIVNGAEQQVRDRIAQDPSVVGAVAAGTPKQHAGQSTLQVAVRSGEFAIAHFLLASGADPGFVDVDSPSGWAKPVLHDALVAAVQRSRWMRQTFTAQSERAFRTVNSASKSDDAYSVVVALLDAGADARAVDSKGCTPLGRAARAAHDVLPRRPHGQPDARDGRPLNPELVEDLSRIFDLLRQRGADPALREPQLDMSLSTYYETELVGAFLAGGARPDPAP